MQPAIGRFRSITDNKQRSAFRDKLNGFVKMYSFLSQIIPYVDRELEMLYTFGRFLLPYLPQQDETDTIRVER